MTSIDGQRRRRRGSASRRLSRGPLSANVSLVLVAALAAGCASERSVPREVLSQELAPGLEVHRRQAPPSSDGTPSPLVTLVHIDPERYELVLLTSAQHGPVRTAEQWRLDFQLTAVINASMYMPNLRSTGYMSDGDRMNNPALNPRFGGFLAFGPRHDGLAPLCFAGTDCIGFDLDSLRADYQVLVQNYRLLDCESRPIEWEDRKLYSSAAVGQDARGWLVLVHTGSACRTSDLARWLGADGWGLRAAHFVEGGADASLVVKAGPHTVSETGSSEGAFAASGPRAIPNVLGIRPR